MTDTLHEHQLTFVNVSRLIILETRNISEQFVEKIKTPILYSKTFFPKIVPFVR